MGKLGEVTTTRLDLPSGDWLDVKSKLLLGDILELSKGSTDEEVTIKGFQTLIEKWSFTEDGTEATAMVPITPETIRKLDPSDVKIIAEYMKATIDANGIGLTDDEKKSSSSVSIPVMETSTPSI